MVTYCFYACMVTYIKEEKNVMDTALYLHNDYRELRGGGGGEFIYNVQDC